MANRNPSPQYANLIPFKKGHDPRRASTGPRLKLTKRLKQFDEDAWKTLAEFFNGTEEQKSEALHLWAKYRLHCLLQPAKEDAPADRAPRMSPEAAAAIAALDS